MDHELPIEKRVMTDCSGKFKDEFIVILENLRKVSLAQYVETINSLFQMFNQRLSDAETMLIRIPDREGFSDFRSEIESLLEKAKGKPVTIGDIYDKHVAILRLASLQSTLVLAIDAEDKLRILENLGQLKRAKFIH